jgi:hypothetical protein
MKSLPKKTPTTPSTEKSFFAKADELRSSPFSKLAVPFSRMVLPGRNLSVAGFGVSSV